ncbi:MULTISPECIES: DUF3313 domain-containing protein [Burkholderia]|uniref:DUF3313 domain-containing protein n=2 Tax=Burkholderia humptydooensis TaxID=430531 RepID=A0A7U4P4S8_9BURK|nr:MULTISPECIES: DUF3313 domain-containing protein [Burkholderia]AGK47601.1 hypothetical protein BTI_2443 [Burkholderia thailandensis MSMB121]ATF34216.1 DUF3313 domain-containing protein [Burkholderia thailandensis]AJY41078.1 hypothetical protein BW21_2411 [Burkholderia sp. 2002721687]ALX42958.1 hypothetical protein AQ610_11405 [Burkholderia humptydooensis]EIP87443.1 hypothetical protein A33K_15463 [Burkholderia humptydooensis MSMB43]
MNRTRFISFLVSSAAALTLTACAGVQPVAYSGLSSSSQLTQNRTGDAAKVPYRYAAQVDWSKYRQVIVDPVVIYAGQDNQFGDLNAQDRATLADYMGKTFTEKLAKRFQIAPQPSPAALRVRLTLTGAEKTTAVVGQAMHFDIAGNLYNGVQAIRGGKGAFSGSVSYAVEVYDSTSGRLLIAYVTKQYPNAMNLPAAFGSLSAARTGIDKGADALVSQLQ